MSAVTGRGSLAEALALGALTHLAYALVFVALLHLAARLGLWRRRPAVWSALWTIAALKLVLPWAPALPGSLADLASRWLGVAPQVEAAARVAGAPPPASMPGGAWWGALASMWISVACWRLARQAWHFRALWQQARALPDAPAHVAALAATLTQEHRWPRRVQLKLAEAAVSPHLVVGPRTAWIVIPAEICEQRDQLQLALAHEVAHLQRYDFLGRWLTALAGAVWWMLPVGRLVGRPLERSQEAAADAAAAGALGWSNSSYARQLLAAAVRSSSSGLGGLGALALAPHGALAERVAALCVHRSRAGLGRVGASAVVLGGALALGGAVGTSAQVGVAACDYDASMARALREVHPEADLDGDGALARDEACALQEQLRRAALQGVEPGAEQARWLPQLCCDCSSEERSQSSDASSQELGASACEE